MSPLDVTTVLEELSASMAPGTIIIVKLFDGGAEEEAEIEEEDSSDAYDMFTDPNGSPGTGGGTIPNAILMDNPGQ